MEYLGRGPTQTEPTIRHFAAWTALAFFSYSITSQLMLMFAGSVARIFYRLSPMGELGQFDSLFYYLMVVYPLQIFLAIVLWNVKTVQFRFIAGLMLWFHSISVGHMLVMPIEYTLPSQTPYRIFYFSIWITEPWVYFLAIRYLFRRRKRVKDYESRTMAHM